tara:strand:- start:332 stop:508 length:177 start_codon:yes stop_codon:yes gene_type:complete
VESRIRQFAGGIAVRKFGISFSRKILCKAESSAIVFEINIQLGEEPLGQINGSRRGFV